LNFTFAAFGVLTQIVVRVAWFFFAARRLFALDVAFFTTRPLDVAFFTTRLTLDVAFFATATVFRAV
jgi:hypothetical protein